YGGSVAPGTSSAIPVPTYVHGTDAAVAKLYTTANGTSAPVVVSKGSDSRESLAQAFQNAWKTVFSKNYRLYMSRTESYSQGFDPNNYTEPWELEPFVMYDELGVRYEAVTEELPNLGLSLRYEY